MMGSKKQPLVGFDRYLVFDWLDQTAKWVIGGLSAQDVHTEIDNYLRVSVPGDTSRRKTKNVLSCAWIKNDGVNLRFKEEAKKLYVSASKAEKVAIHYGLFIATYPFFYSLSQILGRLFKLQDDVSNLEFYRRCIEVNGDRESIKRAAARYLQSISEWGLINTDEKAKVKPGLKIKLESSAVVTWLLASILYSSERSRLSVDEIISDPVWFPFEINPRDFQVEQSLVLEIVHQGVGMSLLALK